jgi:hypothetical protein
VIEQVGDGEVKRQALRVEMRAPFPPKIGYEADGCLSFRTAILEFWASVFLLAARLSI